MEIFRVMYICRAYERIVENATPGNIFTKAESKQIEGGDM